MLKGWICCLWFVSSTVALMAQTESSPAPTTPNQRSWLNGGAGSTAMTSPPLPYPDVREADILWEKRVWRVIDTREKINLTFRHPELSLFNVIAEGLAAGQLQAYSPEDDRFSEQMTNDEIWDKLNRQDSVWVADPITGEYSLQVVTDTFDPDRIKRWRIQEVWYQDSRYSQMQVRIIGIAPLMETDVSDEVGSVSFETPMFWINYNDARSWLAQKPVALEGNDYSRMSWEDLFAMRRFHSYIYQESDMRGRRLSDYLAGPDLLLESKKIDQKIQNREMDMWSQ